MDRRRQRVLLRIADLERDGHSRNEAIYMAMCEERARYFKEHPHGALPEWLSYPKNRRLREHYQPNGAPLKREPYERNPRSRTAARPKAAQQAKRLFEGFTEESAEFAQTIDMPEFNVGIAPGRILGIIYETRIRGEPKKFIHEFRKVKSRPLLIVSSDGKQFRSLGGAFRFTKRGFVDG